MDHPQSRPRIHWPLLVVLLTVVPLPLAQGDHASEHAKEGATSPRAVQTVFDVAGNHRHPEGAPRESDVIMRSLLLRKRSENSPHDTLEALRDFHVTRLEWSYVLDREFIGKVRASGVVYGGASGGPSYLPETNWRAVASVNINGEPLVPSWKRTWKPGSGLLWGCSNNPEFERGHVAYLKQYIDAGVEVMLRDEPQMNEYAANLWGGCFCDYCILKFRDSLSRSQSPEALRELGIANIGAFNYRDLLRKQGAPVGDAFRTWDGGELKRLFVEFQVRSDLEFHRRTRAALDAYAGRRVPFACCNDARNFNELEGVFDWLFGELWENQGHARPGHIRRITTQARELGMRQVITMPNRTNYENLPTWEPLTRRTIAMAYACGGHCMVPWDVFMPGGAHVPRYFGRPEQYADLFGFVRASQKYLDDYEEAATAGFEMEENRYGDAPPVSIAGHARVTAVVRVVPGRAERSAVVHLVDHSDAPSPFHLNVDPHRFFGDAPLRYTLMVPPAYDALAHQKAQAAGDFSGLVRTISVAGGYRSGVTIPALHPWGLLVIEPEPGAKRGVWTPFVEVPPGGLCQEDLVVALRSPEPEAAIHYTLNGKEPSETSPVYAAPLVLHSNAVLRASAHMPGRGASGILQVEFRRRPDTAAAAQPDEVPDLCLWLQADRLRESVPDGGEVSRWPAVVGPEAVMPDVPLRDGKPARPPVFRKSAINGRGAISFDGVDDALAVTGFANKFLGGRAFTIFMVSQSEDEDFGICGNGQNGRAAVPRLYLTRKGFRYSTMDVISPNVEPGRPAITVYEHDGKETIAAFGNGTFGDSKAGIPVSRNFGGGGNLAMPFWWADRNRAGLLADVVVYNRKLGEDERRKVEAYLSRVYGLGINEIWQCMFVSVPRS